LKLFLLFLRVLCGAALAVAAFARLNVNRLPREAVADRVIIEKSARRLTLLKNGSTLKTYRVALGRAPVGAKQYEGDQRTPEGIYSIDFHKPDSDYHLALHISYPEQRDVDRAAVEGSQPAAIS
jgi:murein L,D-transpeptidase YafK